MSSEWLGSGRDSTGRRQRTFGRQRSQSSAPVYEGNSSARGKVVNGPNFKIAIDEEDNPFSESNLTRSRIQSASSLSNTTTTRMGGLKNYDDNVGNNNLSSIPESTSMTNSTKPISKRKNTSRGDSQDAKKKKEARAASPSRLDEPASIYGSTSGSAFGSASKSWTRRKRTDLKVVIGQGIADSLKYILKELNAHSAAGTRGPAFAFIIAAPEHYEGEEANQFYTWLEQAGFAKEFTESKVMMRLADNRLDELRRVVLSEVSRRQDSPEYQNTNKSPSPPVKMRSVSDSAVSHEFDWDRRNIVPITAAPLTRTRSQTAHQLSIDARESLSNVDTIMEGPDSIRQKKSNFAPRRGMLSVGGDRAESPVGLSPYNSSPRFFADDPASGRNTPTGFNSSSGDNDEVPQLGAGMGALQLNRGISLDGVGNYLPPVQETETSRPSEVEDSVTETNQVGHYSSIRREQHNNDREIEDGEVDGDDDGDDKMSDTSTLLDENEKDIFSPEEDSHAWVAVRTPSLSEGESSSLSLAPSIGALSFDEGYAMCAYEAPVPELTRVTRAQAANAIATETVQTHGLAQNADLSPPSIRRTRSQVLHAAQTQARPVQGTGKAQAQSNKVSGNEITTEVTGKDGRLMKYKESCNSYTTTVELARDLNSNQHRDGVASCGDRSMTRDRSPSLTSLDLMTDSTSRTSTSPLPLGRDSNGNLRAAERPLGGRNGASDGTKSPLPSFVDWNSEGSAHHRESGNSTNCSSGQVGTSPLDTTGSQARVERRKTMRAGLIAGGGATVLKAAKVIRALQPGQQTPKTGGGAKCGSNDRAKFNTPQGEAGPILSGRGETDWGVSEATPRANLDKLRNRAHEIRHMYNPGRPSLFRAHSANDIDGHTNIRNGSDGIPDILSRRDTASNRHNAHMGPHYQSSNTINNDAGTQDDHVESSDCTEKMLLVPPAFAGSGSSVLLRSTSHASKLERGVFSPGGRSTSEGPGRIHSSAGRENDPTRRLGLGITMSLTESGSLLEDSPGRGFPGHFGATFPPSVNNKDSTPHSFEGNDTAVSARMHKIGHSQVEQVASNHQMSPSMGGGAFQPLDTVVVTREFGNTAIPPLPSQGVDQTRDDGGEMTFSIQEEESSSLRSHIAHARSVYQKSQMAGFRSIVADTEISLYVNERSTDASIGTNDVDATSETEDLFLERLQRVSPSARKDRRARMSAAKWRRQSLGFRSLGHIGQVDNVKLPESNVEETNVYNLAIKKSNQAGLTAVREEIGADREDEIAQDGSSSKQLALLSSMSPSVMYKGKVSSTKKQQKNATRRGRTTIRGVLPTSPDGSSGDGSSAEESRVGAEMVMQDNLYDVGERSSTSAMNDISTIAPGFNLHHAPSSESDFTLDKRCDIGDIHNRLHVELPGLHARSFRGMVVGGVYQQCFDGPTPVVAPPLSSAARITGVALTGHDSLELRLYYPSRNESKTVDLGQSWRWMRTSPDGYLVLKDQITLPMPRGRKYGNECVICYYLPRHPLDWAEDCEENSAYNQRMAEVPENSGSSHTATSPQYTDHSFASNISFNSSPKSSQSRGETPIIDSTGITPHHADELEERPGHEYNRSSHERKARNRQQVSWADSQSADDGQIISGGNYAKLKHTREHSPLGSVNAKTPFASMDTPGHHYDQQDYYRNLHGVSGEGHTSMDESGEHSDYTAELDVKMVLYADSADWNNAGIISYVLQFLLGDSGDVVSDIAHDVGGGVLNEPSRRSVRGNVRRTQSVENTREDINSYRLVSKSWALGSFRLLARHLSHAENSATLPWSRWAKFVSRYSWGRFLASGACKSVYCVQNASNSGLLEAISVMDVQDLEARGMGNTVTKEMEIALACSSLASLRVCPNLLQVYSLFRSDCPVPSTLWNSQQVAPPPPPIAIGSGGNIDRNISRSASLAVPKKQNLDLGCYQYIRMEYCSGGDMEDFVRDHLVLSEISVRHLLFQMCFSLYCCRDQLALRHFDIKLLNFMVAQGSTLLPPELAACGARRANSPFESMTSMMDRGNVMEVRVGVGHQIYCLPMLIAGKELVKLADFGSSVVGMGGLGDPITVQQFTTLENAPPEYLLMGSRARQGFSADTFPLGLCFLHLLTGHEPYEILMQDVYCPPYLITRLQELWSPDDSEDQYYVVKEAVQSTVMGKDVAEPHNAGYEGAVLAHTLYRYVILFGSLHCDDIGIDTPVWTALQHALLGDPISSSSPSTEKFSGKRGFRKIQRQDHTDNKGHARHATRDECQRLYSRDRAVWGLHEGRHPIMRSVRDRLQSMGNGALKLLERMVHFDPSRRCTMFEALISPVFAPLLDTSLTPEQVASLSVHPRLPSSPTSRSRSSSPRGFLQRSPSGALQHGVAFMHYYRSPEDGGIESIPVV